MKIIYFGSSEKNGVVVKNVVRELDFLYEERLELNHFFRMDEKLKKEILNNDYKKIYIISIDEKRLEKCLKLIEFIRHNDWHSEIILIKEGNVILTNHGKANFHRIFDVISHNMDLTNTLKDDISLICQHLDGRKTFNFRNRDMNLSIYLEKILYIYRDTEERKIVIVTDNNVHTINMGLKDSFYLLDKRFKQVRLE